MEHRGGVYSIVAPRTLGDWRRIVFFIDLNRFFYSRVIVGACVASVFVFVEYLLASAIVAEGTSALTIADRWIGSIIGLCWVAYYRLVKFPKKAMQNVEGVRYRISDGGVEVIAVDAHSFAEWSSYRRWLTAPNVWLLVTSNGSVHAMSRIGLDETTAEHIDKLLTAHLPRETTKYGRAIPFDGNGRVLTALVGIVAAIIYAQYTFHTVNELRRSWVYARDGFCQSRSWSELVRGPIPGMSACTRQTVTLIGGNWNPLLPAEMQEIQVAPLDAGVEVLRLLEPRGSHDFFDYVTRVSPTPAVVQLMDDLPALIMTKYPGRYMSLVRYPFDELPYYFAMGNTAGWVAIVAFYCLLTSPRRRPERALDHTPAYPEVG